MKLILLFIITLLFTSCEKQNIPKQDIFHTFDTNDIILKKIYHFNDDIDPIKINEEQVIDSLIIQFKKEFQVDVEIKDKKLTLNLSKTIDTNCKKLECDSEFKNLKNIYLVVNIKFLAPKENLLGVYGKVVNKYKIEDNKQLSKEQLSNLKLRIDAIFKSIQEANFTVKRIYNLEEESTSSKQMWAIYKNIKEKYPEKISYIKKTHTKLNTDIISTNFIIENYNIKFTLYPYFTTTTSGSKIFYNSNITYLCTSNGYCQTNKNKMLKLKEDIEVLLK